MRKDTEPGTTKASKEAATAVTGTKIYNTARELKITITEWSTEETLSRVRGMARGY